MLDHQEARMWTDHHHALNRFVDDAIAKLRETFEVLAAIRYDAPWRRAEPCRSAKR